LVQGSAISLKVTATHSPRGRRLPATEPLAAIQQRLKCTRCGEKGAIATTIIAPLELAVAHGSGNAAPQ
jgi:hypothetical protein